MPSETGIEPPQAVGLRDRRALWRVFFWGGSTVFALGAAALIATSDLGAQRLQQAAAGLLAPGTAAAIPSQQQVAQTERDIKQLTEAVQRLAGERDRLNGRVASLEQSLSDITGSVKRQAEKLAAHETTLQTRTAGTPPPVISAPATTLAIIPPSDPSLKTAPAPTITGAVPAPHAVPLPPNRGTNVNANADTATEEVPPLVKNEIGIDVGGAANLEALRGHWASVKANQGPLLAGLRPLVVMRTKKPAGIDYRLVLGPLPNAAAAARLCAQFAGAHAYCRAGVFSGQILAVR